MAIRLIHRIQRLVTADAHGLVESLEDRSLLLKQHLREAELELQHKRARIDAISDEVRRIDEDRERLDAALERIEQDAELALAEERDDLARFAIRKLLPLQYESKQLGSRSKELTDERERIAEKLVEQQADFEQLRARVRALPSESSSRDARDGPFDRPSVADEEVEMELLRRKQQGALR